MTIRVTIKNEEAPGGRYFNVYSVERPRKGRQDQESFEATVRAGETREFYIHAARHLIIAEEPMTS